MQLHKVYEVFIDNGSQVNIAHPALLHNLRISTKGYQSMNGGYVTSKVGLLEGFFECKACEDCPVLVQHMYRVRPKQCIWATRM
jgi:hypothetical protein